MKVLWYGFWLLFLYIGCCVICSCEPDKRIQYVANKPHVEITLTNPDEVYVVKFDTIPGRVTYIDTAVSSPDWKGPGILWMKGFEVTTWDMVGTVHVAWLDEQKNPIKYLGLGLIN